MLLVATGAAQQNSAVALERKFAYPVALVQRNLERLRAYEGSRLPMLDGFVSTIVSDDEIYQQPFYQYRLKLIALEPNTTVVKVEAKITAWYASPKSGRSEYRALASNGRLEADLIDRLERLLPAVPVVREECPPAAAAAEGSAKDAAMGCGAMTIPVLHAVGIGSAGRSLTEKAIARQNSVSPEQELETVLSQRQKVGDAAAAAELKIHKLEGSNGAVPPVRLAAVKQSGVGIMSRTSYGGPVLFRAQAEDEFDVIEVQGEWTKVRLGPDSVGWIETDELTLPAEVSKLIATVGGQKTLPATLVSASTAAGSALPSKQADFGFWVAREDVSVFSGDWSRLKGKNALYVYAQPRGLLADLASDETKLAFAKQIFVTRYRKAAASAVGSKDAYEGVVVVFLGARGGVAAATLGDIRQWNDGDLEESAFVSRCSLDPPAEFQRLHRN
jgi:hypothetical protein